MVLLKPCNVLESKGSQGCGNDHTYVASLDPSLLSFPMVHKRVADSEKGDETPTASLEEN